MFNFGTLHALSSICISACMFMYLCPVLNVFCRVRFYVLLVDGLYNSLYIVVHVLPVCPLEFTAY